MNKLPLYILLLCGPVHLHAQDMQEPPPVAPDTVIYKELPADTTAAATFIPTDTVVNTNPRRLEQGFKSKYQGEEFIYYKKAEKRGLWERFLIWLGQVLDEIFSFGGNGKSVPFYAIVIRIILALLLLFVVYLVVKALVNKEGNLWIFGKRNRNIDVHSLAEGDIRQMDFKQLIEETKREGNYRLGVRYYYLWLLKKLSGREIIDWHPDKTNTEYLYEIKDSLLRRDFEYLSYIYDYSWYGDFTIDEAAFAKAEKAFAKTLNTL